MPLENNKELSIVIPVFNEINFLYKLFDQIKLYFNKESVEVIIVDDGSTDGSNNVLRELKEKKDLLPGDIRWHFLGNIQSNKIKDIVVCSDLIHSIGRNKVLDKILKLESNKKIKILLQLKLGEEETKSGFN